MRSNEVLPPALRATPLPEGGGSGETAIRPENGHTSLGSAAPALDRGARALVLLFLGALVVGTVVVAVHPAYRAAFLSMLSGGGDEASPIWRSNANYYDAIDADMP